MITVLTSQTRNSLVQSLLNPGTVAGNLSVGGTFTVSGNTYTTNIYPLADNVYSLGASGQRWKNIFLGSGTIFMTDAVLNTQASLNVSNGVFFINGAVQAQLPTIVANTISTNSISVSGTATISGITTSGITFPDGSKQVTAGNGTIRIAPTGNSVTLDMSTDSIVHIHVNSGTLVVTLSGLTAGRTTELLVVYGNTGGAQVNHGITGSYQSSNSSNGQSFFLPTHQFSSYRYYCVDGTMQNTFVVGQIT